MKKTASSKRAVLLRAADYTKAFSKDWTRLSHSGRYDMTRLKEAMLLLIANDAPLGPEWLDHPLKGDWADHRQCHIGGDFLLIYSLRQTGSTSSAAARMRSCLAVEGLITRYWGYWWRYWASGGIGRC